MPVRSFKIIASMLLLLLFATVKTASAQGYKAIEARIDAFAKKDLPKSALTELNKLNALARKNNNAPMQIRATLYRITFQNAIEENTLVAVIDTLQQQIGQSSFPVKPVLQSLLAQMYWNYYQQNRWQFNQRPHLEKPGTDFTKWDLQTIINETGRLYRLSLSDAAGLQQTPVSVLNGVLSGDEKTRYLRPTLYDLLLQRTFEFFLSDEPALTKPRLPFSINKAAYFGDSRTFAGLVIKTSDTTSTFYQGIRYFQQATIFHLADKQPDALADMELERVKFLFDKATFINKDSVYLSALQRIETNFQADEVKAGALQLQGDYYNQKDSLKIAYDYYQQASTRYPKTIGGKNGLVSIGLIMQKELSATVENINVPGRPLLALLNYRNTASMRVKLYKVSLTTYNRLAAIPFNDRSYSNGASIYPSDSVLHYLQKLSPVQNDLLNLPDPHDYRRHTTEFKINTLQNGVYIMTVDDAAGGKTSLALSTFKITRLAYVTRILPAGGTEIRVMDRETGKPLAGVHCIIAETDNNKMTDENGRCVAVQPIDRGYSVKLMLPGDTLYVGNNYDNPIYDPEIRTIANTIFFTDRSIYRPGQTVYFKGLHIQSNGDKRSILTGTYLTVKVQDNNGKEIVRLPVTTNAFGTFAGSFIIPQNILNGNISISTGFGSTDVRVEEYKRPTFDVAFLPVKESYKLNDSVKVKGTVTAFSGYGLSQARVAYHITRQLNVINYNNYGRYNILMNNNNLEIAADTVMTDAQGNFIVKFKAAAEPGVNVNDLNYVYSINADVTDGSGETRSANTSVTVGNHSVLIDANIPAKVLAHDSIRFTAKITNLNNVTQPGSISVKVYALDQPGGPYKIRLWQKPDQLLMDASAFKKDFPDYSYGREDEFSSWKIKDKVVEINLETGDKGFEIINLDELRKQPGGIYKVVIEAKNSKGDTASIVKYLTLISEHSKPIDLADFVVPMVTATDGSKPVEFLVGNGSTCRVLMEKYNGTALLSSRWLTIAGNQELIKVPVLASEQNVSLQFLMTWHNRVYTQYQNIDIKKPSDKLDIKFLTFRDKLQPGEKEQWKLQISGKNNEKLAAEMVADLYDASLDKIAGGTSWEYLLNSYRYLPNYFNWSTYNMVTPVVTVTMSRYLMVTSNFVYRNYERLITFSYDSNGLKEYAGDYYPTDYTNGLTAKSPGYYSSSQLLQGRAAGVSVMSMASPGAATTIKLRGNNSLNEVIVTGYQTQKKVDISGAVYGLSTSDAKEISAGASEELLKNVLSTSPIAVRKNFNETAFFYPQLHTNEKGEILIDFTMPEALTKWRFKAFAHTADLKTGYLESEVVTQKQLSINANMPRFFREGDTITVSARLANLTAGALKGKVHLQLFNAINMQPVSLLVNGADSSQEFNIDAAATKPVAFKMIIPFGLEALTYRLTASAGNYSDGEENTFPVLPNRMLVTESMPMMVRPGQTRNYTFDKLVNQTSRTLQSKTLTLEYTENPAWYAVQAIPYLMEYPYECSEQTFSRYFANSMATNLVNHFPVIKQVFDQWKAANSGQLLFNLEKNPELKSTLLEETPWLRDAISESEQKKRIALLFDLNKISYELKQNLDKLQQMQLGNGGFPWFGGDRADRYITQHILAGIGQLYQAHITDNRNLQLKAIADKAMGYLDDEMLKDDARSKADLKDQSKRVIDELEIHAFYAQSFFTARTMSAPVKQLLAEYLKRAAGQWQGRAVYDKGLIALTMLRNQKPDIAKAIIRSLKETAQQSDELGMYWSGNRTGYFWYQAPIETQSLMIELFVEAGANDKAVEEMKIWLLRSKQTSNWQTTKATAAACYALLMKGDSLLANQKAANISLGGVDLNRLKPVVKADAGTGYIKTNWVDEQVKPELGKVSITNNSKVINWSALHWQYLENLDKITSSQTDIHLERKYFISRQTAAGEVLVAVNTMHQPKTGDLLKVVVNLKADRDFEYVQLKDMRPAGTEPVDVLSNYKYQDGMYYYQVTKDVATNFFISYLNKGNYVFEYRLRVSQPGNLSTGITSIQCLYAPEFNAHSEGARMRVGQ